MLAGGCPCRTRASGQDRRLLAGDGLAELSKSATYQGAGRPTGSGTRPASCRAAPILTNERRVRGRAILHDFMFRAALDVVEPQEFRRQIAWRKQERPCPITEPRLGRFWKYVFEADQDAGGLFEVEADSGASDAEVDSVWIASGVDAGVSGSFTFGTGAGGGAA